MIEQRQLHQDSAEARLALFDFAFDHAPIGIALVDTRGRLIRSNAALARLVGMDPDTLINTPFADFTHPDDLENDLAHFQKVLDGEQDGYSIEKRYIRPDGGIVHVRIHVAAMRNRNGKVARFITQIEDITQQKKHEMELAERAAQVELVMEAIRGGFWHMDVGSGNFQTSERLAQFINGPDSGRMNLDSYLQRMNEEDEQAASLAPLIAGDVDQSVAEYRLKTVSGERWMRCDRRLLRDENGAPLRIVGVAIDFTDEHHKLQQLELNSETDALTGLLNRRGLQRRFETMVSASGYVLLALDLDGFKQVNDRHGHGAGDRVLAEVGRRLRLAIRGTDLVARTGGDEFILVLSGDRQIGEDVAARIVQSIHHPVALEEGMITISATIGGVSLIVKTSLDEPAARADAFLYEAKKAGKNRWLIG